MKRRSTFVSALASSIAAALITNTAFGTMPEANFWSQRRHAAQTPTETVQLASLPLGGLVSSPSTNQDNGEALAASVRVAELESRGLLPASGDVRLRSLFASLPHAFGTVQRVTAPTGSQRGVLIHIQDVHGNLEAQTNISSAIGQLEKNPSMGLFALEGAFGDVDAAALQKFSDRHAVRMIADYLLKENKISGAGHAILVSDPSHAPFVGVDDRRHYSANVQAYRNSLRADGNEKAALLRAQLERNKNLLNSNLRAFDQKVQDFHAEKIHFGDYVGFLSGAEGQASLHPNVNLFLKALALEDGLRMPRVETERAALVAALVEKISDKQKSDLVDMALAARSGVIRQADFYRLLKNLCERAGVSLSRYPAMQGYLRYSLMADGIDSDALLTEVAALERAGYSARARTPEEKRLVAESRRLYLAGKLREFSLTKTEWDEYKTAPSPFEGEGAVRSPFESFYLEAQARDEAMTANLLRAMKDKKTSVAVLVTGGFHTDGIDERLRAAGYTTITFAPKITKLESDNGAAYLSVFTREKSPLEKLFQGDKLFLGDNPLSEPVNQMAKDLVMPVEEIGNGAVPLTVAEQKMIEAQLGLSDEERTKDTGPGRAAFDVTANGVIVTGEMNADEALQSVEFETAPRLRWGRRLASFKKAAAIAFVLFLPSIGSTAEKVTRASAQVVAGTSGWITREHAILGGAFLGGFFALMAVFILLGVFKSPSSGPITARRALLTDEEEAEIKAYGDFLLEAQRSGSYLGKIHVYHPAVVALEPVAAAPSAPKAATMPFETKSAKTYLSVPLIYDARSDGWDIPAGQLAPVLERLGIANFNGHSRVESLPLAADSLVFTRASGKDDGPEIRLGDGAVLVVDVAAKRVRFESIDYNGTRLRGSDVARLGPIAKFFELLSLPVTLDFLTKPLEEQRAAVSRRILGGAPMSYRFYRRVLGDLERDSRQTYNDLTIDGALTRDLETLIRKAEWNGAIDNPHAAPAKAHFRPAAQPVVPKKNKGGLSLNSAILAMAAFFGSLSLGVLAVMEKQQLADLFQTNGILLGILALAFIGLLFGWLMTKESDRRIGEEATHRVGLGVTSGRIVFYLLGLAPVIYHEVGHGIVAALVFFGLKTSNRVEEISLLARYVRELGIWRANPGVTYKNSLSPIEALFIAPAGWVFEYGLMTLSVASLFLYARGIVHFPLPVLMVNVLLVASAVIHVLNRAGILPGYQKGDGSDPTDGEIFLWAVDRLLGGSSTLAATRVGHGGGISDPLDAAANTRFQLHRFAIQLNLVRMARGFPADVIPDAPEFSDFIALAPRKLQGPLTAAFRESGIQSLMQLVDSTQADFDGKSGFRPGSRTHVFVLAEMAKAGLRFRDVNDPVKPVVGPDEMESPPLTAKSPLVDLYRWFGRRGPNASFIKNAIESERYERMTGKKPEIVQDFLDLTEKQIESLPKLWNRSSGFTSPGARLRYVLAINGLLVPKQKRLQLVDELIQHVPDEKFQQEARALLGTVSELLTVGDLMQMGEEDVRHLFRQNETIPGVFPIFRTLLRVNGIYLPQGASINKLRMPWQSGDAAADEILRRARSYVYRTATSGDSLGDILPELRTFELKTAYEKPRIAVTKEGIEPTAKALQASRAKWGIPKGNISLGAAEQIVATRVVDFATAKAMWDLVGDGYLVLVPTAADRDAIGHLASAAKERTIALLVNPLDPSVTDAAREAALDVKKAFPTVIEIVEAENAVASPEAASRAVHLPGVASGLDQVAAAKKVPLNNLVFGWLAGSQLDLGGHAELTANEADTLNAVQFALVSLLNAVPIAPLQRDAILRWAAVLAEQA